MATLVRFCRDACKGCGLCVHFCPKGLIQEDLSYLNAYGVHPMRISRQEECIACANCAVMCPDGVITVEKE